MAKPPKTKPAVTVEQIESISSRPETGHAGLHPNFIKAREKTQYPPGQSGNPGGRRPRVVSDTIYRLATAIHEFDEKGRSYLELLTLSLIQEGLSGNVQAIKEVMDRLEGKAPTGQREQTAPDRLAELIYALHHPHVSAPKTSDHCVKEPGTKVIDESGKKDKDYKG